MLIHPRKRRTFPTGTFINTKARLLAIIQLSLAFTLICWNLSLPFMGELFDYKKRASIYHTVMGETKFLKLQDKDPPSALHEKLLRHRERFQHLPKKERRLILKQYEQLQKKQNQSWLYKSWLGMKQLLWEQPTFQMAWLCLSIIIPIMLLLKIESARQAVWLLPIVAAIYACDHLSFAAPRKMSPDEQLFPTEKTLVDTYLKKPLTADIFEQQAQLKRGWQLYLIDQWTGEAPSTDEALFQQQAEEGEFAFHLERLKQLPQNEKSNTPQEREPLLLLLVYIAWNLFFALSMTKLLSQNPMPVPEPLPD